MKSEIEKRILKKAPSYEGEVDYAYQLGWDHGQLALAEALAKDAKILSGVVQNGTLSNLSNQKDTHTCIAVDFQAIDQSVSVKEIAEMLKKLPLGKEVHELADRIEKYGIKS
jgi:hypothetical protein